MALHRLFWFAKYKCSFLHIFLKWIGVLLHYRLSLSFFVCLWFCLFICLSYCQYICLSLFLFPYSSISSLLWTVCPCFYRNTYFPPKQWSGIRRRDEDPVESVDFGLPDPDPVPFSWDPKFACNNGLISFFFILNKI